MLARWPDLLLFYMFLSLSLYFSGELPTCHSQVPPAPPLPDQKQMLDTVQNELDSLTKSVTTSLADKFSFCISDPEEDLNETFGFSSDMEFVNNCFQTNEDLAARLCTTAEIKWYFKSLYNDDGELSKSMKPNLNCNSTSWVSGCQSGWACSLFETQTVTPSDAADIIPARIDSCRPCCEGFFCPSGLTCMTPCPLGAYCPVATLNESTGLCDPYGYQIIPENKTSTCGAADLWADVGNTLPIFCPAGSYCPSTIEQHNCSSGHYCRLGSTSENRCTFKKSWCKPNSSKENLAILGVLLIVALVVLLLVIYNFSGLYLFIRERRQAKRREKAAQMAKGTVQARQKWKIAREIVKTHVTQFNNHLSRTFTNRRIQDIQEQPLMHLNDNNSSNSIRSMEEGGESTNGSKGNKTSLTKGKHRQTETQIFKFAYGEIEKEKALHQENKKLNFEGVFAMATTTEDRARARPLLEVEFKDLTLTLGKKKLLRSITGKLMPGRVTAVMGPSGAGKTTFLNAVAGKVTAGCKRKGLVLVNGRNENIRSYKKIIGFVPQDDIVHGNLTVEENLWFSAKCRLSANMPRANKVLIVERVIESLGLQGVRNSLVGTVEKRGISGGQRKRVNVGLEMVMEPSLLILDEPTSGLDSSSSQLLLRALRREALEGVNISAVIHQPSYTLYKMFDDLILLAKGGFIVYQGPIDTVEDYFSTLGINVPDRVNPPDYFIDILEGIIKPNSSINFKHLPLNWILHNGYDVPKDMREELIEMEASSMGGEPRAARSGFREEIGNDINALGVERDGVDDHAKGKKDLTNRKTPGILKQYKYYLGRVTKQRLRDAKAQAIDYLILGLAGICLGKIARFNDMKFGADSYIYVIIAISLLCQIAALKSFSQDRLEFLRERASGMSSLAYFLSKDTVDHFNTVVKPAVFLSMFYYFNSPRSTFTDNYKSMMALVYCVTGIGYTFAICFQPGAAQLWSALLPVVLTLLSTQSSTPSLIADLCYPKWALEAFVIINAKRYSGVWLITRCAILLKFRYDINHWGLCITVLFLYGLLFRIIAFICLILLQKR